MRIELRLFAHLRDRLPAGSPRGRCELQLPTGATVRDVLAHMGIHRASAAIVLVNGAQRADLDDPLGEGDVLSIFPPLAGGCGARPMTRALQELHAASRRVLPSQAP